MTATTAELLPIRVLHFERRPLGENKERTLAIATVRIGPVTITDVALLQIGNRQSVGLPRRYKGSQGWQPIVEVSSPTYERLLLALQDAYDDAT